MRLSFVRQWAGVESPRNGRTQALTELVSVGLLEPDCKGLCVSVALTRGWRPDRIIFVVVVLVRQVTWPVKRFRFETLTAEGRWPNMFHWAYENQRQIEQEFEDIVRSREFPCVGAKSALGRGTLKVVACRSISSAWDDLRMHEIARQWASDYKDNPGLFRSLAFVFEGPDDLSEEAFEAALWDRIQSMTDKDEWRGIPPDRRVSTDPDDPHFSLSFGGEAFFVVGLHPHASRPARRFPRPAMVLNLHDQFEELRASGRYEALREAILGRDKRLAGSINPMLSRHGEVSEARQYSGREVSNDWDCPFSGRGTDRA